MAAKLGGLHRLYILQFCSEDPVPETTCDTKAVFEVGEMVLEMILLQFTVIVWQARIISTIVGQ